MPESAAGVTADQWGERMPRSVGFFLYYPSRRQMPAALHAFVDFLRKETRGAARTEARTLGPANDARSDGEY